MIVHLQAVNLCSIEFITSVHMKLTAAIAWQQSVWFCSASGM